MGLISSEKVHPTTTTTKKGFYSKAQHEPNRTGAWVTVHFIFTECHICCLTVCQTQKKRMRKEEKLNVRVLRF